MNPHDHGNELRFLGKIGVDTRFLSVYHSNIFINNQRFSKFTRKREEQFLRNYPDFQIHRSGLFQRLCTRASRVLASSIEPREKILIPDDNSCTDFALKILLEPYKRKYGIQILSGNMVDFDPAEYDSIAMATTLDDEAVHVLNRLFNGEKMDVVHQINTIKMDHKLIYPLQNIPSSWIVEWIENLGHECEFSIQTNYELETLSFLGNFVSDVRENILKSALFISENSIE
jgi:hypothetical protein